MRTRSHRQVNPTYPRGMYTTLTSNNAGLPNVCQEFCFQHATFLVGLQLPRKRHNIAHKNKTPREIVTGKRMPFKDIKGMVIGMVCWGHEHKDIRATANSPKAKQGVWAGFDPLSNAHLIYLPFTHQLLVRPTVSGGASTVYGDMFGPLPDIRAAA